MAKSGEINIKSFKSRLQAERVELHHLGDVTTSARKPVELDQTTQGRLSRMDAMQVQEMALEQGRRREVELLKIDAALKRMAEGDYGYCTNCGEDIELKRLEFDPAAPLCLACARN